MKLHCINCSSIYEIKTDRRGNGKLPKYCPFCRNNIVGKCESKRA